MDSLTQPHVRCHPILELSPLIPSRQNEQAFEGSDKVPN